MTQEPLIPKPKQKLIFECFFCYTRKRRLMLITKHGHPFIHICRPCLELAQDCVPSARDWLQAELIFKPGDSA